MLAAGETVAVELPFTVADGFKVQANPAASEFLIPLELTLASSEVIAVVSVAYPPAHRFRLEGTTEDLLTYHGASAVTVTVQADPNAGPGEYVVAGTLGYQACNARRCLFPTSLAVQIKVVVRR